MKISVRQSDGSVLHVEMDSADQTIAELKGAIEPQCTPPCPPSLQKLVFRGKVMRDTDTLSEHCE